MEITATAGQEISTRYKKKGAVWMGGNTLLRGQCKERQASAGRKKSRSLIPLRSRSPGKRGSMSGT